MSRIFIFADEAGCMEFSRQPNVSKYFILATASMSECSVGDALNDLRRELAWEGHELGEYFHATTDKQLVRDRVYGLICKYDFKIQATVMEKSKAQPQLCVTPHRFYQYSWYYHFKHSAPRTIDKATELMVVAASIGTRRQRASFQDAVKDVLRQTMPHVKHQANFCPAAADPCLQIADYAAWAIQRKWESPAQRDCRSYNLIKDRITYEFDLFEKGSKHHY